MERLPAAARHGESSKDVDLERLEDSLRWLQRQAAGHLPRVAPVPLISGLTPLDTPHYNNRERIGRRRAKSLEPELMPPPPSAPLRRYLRASLALFSTSIVVAVAGYYIGQTGWSPPTLQVAKRSPPKSMASPTVGARAMRPILARDDDPDTLPANEASDRARGIAELAKLTERSAMAVAPTDEPEIQIPAKPPGGLEVDQIKLLVKQGKQFASAGDLASARVFLQRAAQAGDATAAMALGATYDPVVHAQIGVVGLGADIEQARSWYQKAERLGSMEATWRLQALANR